MLLLGLNQRIQRAARIMRADTITTVRRTKLHAPQIQHSGAFVDVIPGAPDHNACTEYRTPSDDSPEPLRGVHASLPCDVRQRRQRLICCVPSVPRRGIAQRRANRIDRPRHLRCDQYVKARTHTLSFLLAVGIWDRLFVFAKGVNEVMNHSAVSIVVIRAQGRDALRSAVYGDFFIQSLKGNWLGTSEFILLELIPFPVDPHLCSGRVVGIPHDRRRVDLKSRCTSIRHSEPSTCLGKYRTIRSSTTSRHQGPVFPGFRHVNSRTLADPDLFHGRLGAFLPGVGVDVPLGTPVVIPGSVRACLVMGGDVHPTLFGVAANAHRLLGSRRRCNGNKQHQQFQEFHAVNPITVGNPSVSERFPKASRDRVNT